MREGLCHSGADQALEIIAQRSWSPHYLFLEVKQRHNCFCEHLAVVVLDSLSLEHFIDLALLMLSSGFVAALLILFSDCFDMFSLQYGFAFNSCIASLIGRHLRWPHGSAK